MCLFWRFDYVTFFHVPILGNICYISTSRYFPRLNDIKKRIKKQQEEMLSNKDTTSYSYMDDNEHFADVFNYFLYNGKQVIKPNDLVTANSVEKAIINKLGNIMTTKKARDLIKGVNIKHGNNVTYALLGIENQSLVHYAMPVRNMLVDVDPSIREFY